MPDLVTPSLSNFSLRIKNIIQETADTRSFELERTDGAPLVYQAGQFLTFLFRKRNGEEVRRNYSISSVPALHESLQITVKRIANGEFSRKLVDEAKVGDLLQSIGASGFFTLPDDTAIYKNYLFFAAGSGITPVYPLIHTLLQTTRHAKVLLVYSNTSPDTTIFLKKILSLQKEFSNRFTTEFFFSNTDQVQNKRLSAFRTEALLQQYVGEEKSAALFYLCGPFEYMRMISIVLLSNAVPKAHIRKENFTIAIPSLKPLPPDTDEHEVQIELGFETYQIKTRYPETILQSARKKGIPVPFSCESGQCGTCAATCISGKVWMWRNDVLLDEEIAKGRVLTCTGYPVGGDVLIRF